MLAIIFVLLSVILLSVWILSTSKKKLPPGPKGKPLIGVLTELDTKKMHQQLVDWTHKYGQILSFKVFGTVSVVISDGKLIRDAYSSSSYANLFNDRPATFVGKYVVFNYSNVGFAMYDDATTKLRKAMHKGLHFYGDGIKQFEDLMTKELKRLMKEIRSHQGKEVDPRPIIQNSIGLLVSALLLGREIQDGDNITTKAIWEFLEIVNEALIPAVDTTLRIVPGIRFLPSYFRQVYKDVISKRDNVLKTFYLDQKRTYNPEKHRGLVDMFLSLQYKNGEKHLTDEQVMGLILDAISGAMLTTTNTILGLLLTLSNNRHCMKKIQEELDVAVENDKLPEFCDRVHTPYVEATVLEILRYATPVPLMPHCCKKDVEFNGYLIPAGAQIFANTWYINHNPDLFPDPWTFKPERFLDDSGQLLDAKHPNRMNVLSFGVGPRNCVGESLAKSRIILYLSTVLKNFDVVVTSDTSANPHLYEKGIVLEPPRYKCKFVPRSLSS